MGNYTNKTVPLNILDLAPLSQGMTPKDALDASLKLAILADEAGYKRYWMAEHHGSRAFMSCATSLLLSRAAEHTSRIRLGAGGVMLPNHAPLMVAEYYGTLATIYGPRIDLGVGRAPGTDPVTAAALRRSSGDKEDFSSGVSRLCQYLGKSLEDDQEPQVVSAEASALGIEYGSATELARVHAFPGEGTQVPIWVLSSTAVGAKVAGELGLPYSFASHFAPGETRRAIRTYQESFNPKADTAQVERPTVMAGVNVVCAPTTSEAEFLFTTAQQMTAAVRRGQAGILPPPVAELSSVLTRNELTLSKANAGVTAVGEPRVVARKLQDFARRFEVDELIVATYVFDPLLRRRSYELLAQAWQS